MEEIDLKELFQIFWERKSTIILLVAIFIVIGYIYSSFMVVPKYESYTTLILTKADSVNNEAATGGITTTDITLNSKLISTYSELIKSSSVIRQVISNLKIEDSEASIKSSISVTAVSDTEILKITVANEDPEKAADIANEIVVVFAEEVKRHYGINNVSTVDVAEPSNSPANINHTKTIIIFGAVGFIIAAGYIFILFMLDNSIKTGEDVEKHAHVPVLASIPVYEPEHKVGGRSARNQKKTKGGKRK